MKYDRQTGEYIARDNHPDLKLDLTPEQMEIINAIRAKRITKLETSNPNTSSFGKCATPVRLSDF